MIRWGIIGCGDVTEKKSGPGFQKANGSTLVAVMRRSGEKARDYAERHGVPKWYDDADALINDPDVDAVSIATPPGTHLYYALKVCAAGKPAYVEKPLARNMTEAAHMVDAFEQAGVKLFAAYYRRALPRFVKTKELIEGGAIGTLTGVAYRYVSGADARIDPERLPWRLDAKESGGGLFMDLGCHTLDVIDFIAGPLSDVAGTAANATRRIDVENSVAMSFAVGGGIPGTAQWNFATIGSEDLIEFHGSRGRIALSTFGDEPVRLITEKGTETFELPNPVHVQQPLIQSIVDELLGRGICPSTGSSALRTAVVMDQVLAGYYGGRDDAFWERPETWSRRA